MRARLASVLAAVLALAPLGCGDDDGGNGGGDGGDETPDAGGGGTPDAAAAVSLEDLCDPDDGLFIDYYDTLIECTPLFSLLLGTTPTHEQLAELCVGTIGPYLDDGTMTLGDASAFGACRAYIDGIDCSTVLLGTDMSSACDDVIVGHVGAGDDCDTNEQCAGDAFCADPAQGVTCGTCTARLADGVECVEDQECTGRYCRAGAGGAPGSCSERGGVGDGCEIKDDCAGQLACGDGGLCEEAAPAAVDDPCDPDAFLDQCGGITGDLYCSPATSMCQLYREVGETCGFPEGPGLCRVFEYQTCQDVEGTMRCVEPTIVGNGAECGFFAGDKCIAGSSCRDHDGNPDTNDQCADLVGEGEACDVDLDECDVLLTCVGGMCQYGEYTAMCPAP